MNQFEIGARVKSTHHIICSDITGTITGVGEHTTQISKCWWVGFDNGQRHEFYVGYLEFVSPPARTPFEKSVHDYIARELYHA